MKPIVHVIGDIVERISNNISNELPIAGITGIHYEYGHLLEIINTTSEKDLSEKFKFDKYPLIALIQDFPEDYGDLRVENEVTLHLLILNSTNPEYKAKERYEKSFEPILYPIYEELLKQINREGVFLTYGTNTITHRKWDRLFWGRSSTYNNVSNIFNDYLDAIEIENLRLKTILKPC